MTNSKKSRRPSLSRLEKLIDRFARLRLLVIGDLVLDEYIVGDVERVSPEAPVPVVHVADESVALGGAANVVRNIVALGADVDYCAVVGDDDAGSCAAELLEQLGVDASGLVVVEKRPTTRKSRILARGQQVVRFDRETLVPPPASAGKALLAAIDRAIPRVDGVIFEDYGKGMLSKSLVSRAMARFVEADLPVAVDPKSAITPFRGAELLKPNLKEAGDLAGMAIDNGADLARAMQRLQRKVGGGAVVVTQGPGGIALLEGNGGVMQVPTVAREVFDVQGAGDTTVAALTLALRAGASLHEAAIIANSAGGVVVGKMGTATASADEVKGLLSGAVAAAMEIS